MDYLERQLGECREEIEAEKRITAALLEALKRIADYFGSEVAPGKLRFSDAANFARHTITQVQAGTQP